MRTKNYEEGKMKRTKRAQSVLEYVIILTAIVVGVIAGIALFIGDKNIDSPTGIGKIMKKAGTKITDASAKVKTIVP